MKNLELEMALAWVRARRRLFEALYNFFHPEKNGFVCWLLGGRPMTLVREALFDVVARRRVYLWRDNYGRYWLAFTRWSRFRVPVDNDFAQLLIESKKTPL
jgi:hypothetical protein